MGWNTVRRDLDTDPDVETWGQVTRAAGFDAFAATPSSTNLRALLTDETGTGAAVFGTNPTITITPTGAAASRDLQTRAADEINLLDEFITGETNYQSAWTRCLARQASTGAEIVVKAKSTAYEIDGLINLPAGTKVRCEDGVTFKLKDSATPNGTSLYMFRPIGSNVTWVGGTLDFNRAGQGSLRSAFNSGGGYASGYSYHGIWARAVVGTIDNIKIHCKVINSVAFGVRVDNTTNIDLDVVVSGSGAGVALNSVVGGIVRRAECLSINNDDGVNGSWKVFCHGFTAYYIEDLELPYISVPDQESFDTSSGNANSDWFSGITIVGSRNLRIGTLFTSGTGDPDATKSVGVSMLAVFDFSIDSLVSLRHTSCLWEIADIENGVVKSYLLDGEYKRASTLWPSELSEAIHVINQGFLGTTYFRALSPVRNMKFNNGRAKRCFSVALRVWLMCDTEWTDCWFDSCLDGIELHSNNTSDAFVSENQSSRNNIFRGGGAKYNDRHGILHLGSKNAQFIDFDASNNNQKYGRATANTLRSGGTDSEAGCGYYGKDAALVVARSSPKLISFTARDTQTETGKCSYDSDTPTRIHVWEPDLYHEGQTISIANGATGPAALKTWVANVGQDYIDIADAMTNFPSTSGTGTISTSGTAITGSGTAFLTQMQGPTVIESGGVRRLVLDVDSNTSATLEEAFPSNLAGASFTVYSTDADQVASQAYGVRTSNSNDDGLFASDLEVGGSVTADISLGGTADIRRRSAGVWEILASGYPNVSHTLDTVETTLATIAVPGRRMGANGALRITSIWQITNVASGLKTCRTRFGGTSIGAPATSSVLGLLDQRIIQNANSASSQICGPPASIFGPSTTETPATASINTNNSQNITLTATLGSASDTITLKSYLVEVMYQP